MQRRNFLKNFAILGIGLPVIGQMPSDIMMTPKRIKIYDNYIRGTNFYPKTYEKVTLKLGDSIELVREANNRHDRFAIALKKDGWQLGYVAAFENVVLAMLLDQGIALFAEINEVDESDHYPYNEVGFAVYTEVMIENRPPMLNELQNERADNAEDRYRRG